MLLEFTLSALQVTEVWGVNMIFHSIITVIKYKICDRGCVTEEVCILSAYEVLC